ncbi:MAG TPA: ABC transporter permease [bacterium]|nr:ABC transporter permease [bacterium]
MTAYLLRRLSYSLIAFWGVLTIVFTLLHLTGDPAALLAGDLATPDILQQIRHSYGLDQPLPVQYVQFLGQIVRGNFGYSYRQSLPVLELIGGHIGPTIELAVSALVVTVLIGVPLGVIAGANRGSPVDTTAMLASLFGLSIPSFWLGLMLIIVFGVLLGWLPVSGYGGLNHLIMPAVVLGGFEAAQLSRLTRTGLLEVLAQDYVRTARAKGLAPRLVLIKHALRNAALPVLTIVGLGFGRMLGGAVVVETIFAWPGMGRLGVQAVLARDFPVVLGTVVIGAAIFLVVNFLVDMSYGWIDPRLRTGASDS